MERSLNRREVLAGAGALMVAGAPEIVLAKDEAPATPPAKANAALIAASLACVEAGDACVAHCLMEFKRGDTMLADCAASVERMLAVCNATARLAALGSTHLAAFVAVCADVCRDCEAECRKHASHHAVCKTCADACAGFIAAAKPTPA
ncbi:MAG: Csp1 family four helix bundle copper storage protein [bacterium]|nr:Csp1 family four helix bundle copper storage protein [bacterium]